MAGTVQQRTADEVAEQAPELGRTDAVRAIRRGAALMGQDQGKCGVHNYPNINQARIDLMIAEMRKQGMSVTGSNPWDVDTKQHGVKLRGTWDSGTQILSIIVTDKAWYVPCNKIWEAIDPLIPHIQELPDHEVAAILQTLAAE